MEKKEILNIPFVAHESSMNRMERANKRLIVLNVLEMIIIVVMFIFIMAYFLIPEEIEENNQNIKNIKDSEISQNMEK